MNLSVLKETHPLEARSALSPAAAKKLKKLGATILVESGAGAKADFLDEDFRSAGCEIVTAQQAWNTDIVLGVNRPTSDQLKGMKAGSLLLSLFEPYAAKGELALCAEKKLDVIALESVPRTSRAQSMDVLSSQANIAGYRAVLEAIAHYGRFVPMMMTSAGMAKPAQLVVLGAGVAGLQAIATARRMGAAVEAFDVRPEVKEQILSLGAKFMDLDLGETGTGQGGYAKELSPEAKAKQQQLLTERLKKADIIITTANVPGRKAPTLITEDAVKGMKRGSVIVDMAAPSGGNCPLTEKDKVVEKNGVTIIGLTNYASLVPSVASDFFGNNLVNLLGLILKKNDSGVSKTLDLQDDIIAGCLVVHEGKVRFNQ
jgi:NAD(P) transhydrogenase subunit alpha